MANNRDIHAILADAAPNDQHDWLMATKLVAEGYGCSDSSIRKHKMEHADELLEGQHWLKDGGGSTQWTKRGVIRLGMFITSSRAKQFRDLAETLVLSSLGGSASGIVTQAASGLPAAEELGRALAQEIHRQQHSDSYEAQVNASAEAELQRLQLCSRDALGKSLASRWGLSPERIQRLMGQPQATTEASP